ncbi:ScbA/BarX family gamma-butyrolactone biosynthesis protein [Sphaerisporangium corydalis]|uniref:ScbA/BarX family gamma-butyrolactone biosynthesis protein n=1 Tax=Sphaerisporangium corydalis TaxID=1441875 RepID=A0ABV9ETR8_9ACTN|nr:ScbA/BarX family gamma-butyrolactone biosynthesis protein [Sphaerisporangium corydalis]
MSAQLSVGNVSPPSTWQSASPVTPGWDDRPEPARDAHLPGPRFVPRELVHKAAAERVLLTDGVRDAPDDFIIAAMLPRDHCLYQQDDSGWIDPVLPTEALRQAGYYIQHRFYGVPETHKFILGAVTLGIGGIALPTRTPWLPVNLRVTCTPTAKWTGRRLCMRLDAEFSVAGVVQGHGSLLSQAVDPRLYQAVRGRKVAPAPRGSVPFIGRPLSPGEVGRSRPEDVLLADDGNPDGWMLRLDNGNTEMVDHAVDHVPGMVLLEAFRQAALAATRPLTGRRVSPDGLRTDFTRFCELDAPVRIVAWPGPGCPEADRISVHVLAEQDGKEVASGTVELRLGPDTSSGQDLW